MKSALLFPGLFIALFTASPLLAELNLGSPFTDHMVLQRQMNVPVWGTADAGATVTVEFAGIKKSATADAEGKWRVTLSFLTTSDEPREFVVSSVNLESKLENRKLQDVLVGEVWLASGQSNMVFTVSKTKASFAGLVNEAEVIAAANYPKIRMFTAKDTKNYEPQSTVVGTWQVCSPETVPGFSAIGYLFARDVQKELNVPIGILTVAAGASCAEAWISREALTSAPQLKFMLDSLDACVKYFRASPQGPVANAPTRPTPINKPRTPVTQLRDPVNDQHFATVLFNGMLNAVIPYAIRGALWYQGESICWGTRGLDLYGDVQKTMIKDWRARWGEGDFPFFLVQLPGQQNISNNPRIREQQAAVLALPKTAMAVAIDVGEAKDVHPHNKVPVANRLAWLALAEVYNRRMGGHRIDARSPTFDSLRIDGSTARVRFSHASGGLVVHGGGGLKGFQIAGADQKFVDAETKISGDTVIVSSPAVAAPIAVRYAWDNFPEGLGCNLANLAGLPAAPFRTDTWAYPIPGLVEN